jgi:hypothetical protein
MVVTGGDVRRRIGSIVATAAVSLAMTCTLVAPANAEPTVDELAPPLPIVVPTPNGFQPQFPYPYDETRASVTPADVQAEGEMCQWYNAQYETLMTQIDNFDINLIKSNGDYRVANNEDLANAIAANIDQSTAFLAPRAQALTQTQDYLADVYFPLYQGESFFRLWQHLSNVSAGIRGRQQAWFYGPSVQRALRWGSRINRSHVCR